MKRAYISNKNKKIYKILLIHEIDSFHNEIKDLISVLNEGDEIIVYDVEEMNLSIRDLIATFESLRGKNIQINFINQLSIDLDTYLDVIQSALQIQKSYVAKKTKEGLKKARLKGKKNGRPKISQEKVKAIQYLYLSQNLPLRSISEKTDVSLGTVYKYVKKVKSEEIK
ncbi:recombinase family protein [uncultured Vagococcus sp.]|uniref:recombinase family protein n=1 Tax=uncultured Vagococcus sp. TaxID=189676 RepID=UPI00258331A6|nr:recombinase family protein [uncultured Vagococcus sp.]